MNKALNKSAQLSDITSKLQSGLSNVTSNLGKWWSNLPADTKKTVMRGLAGAGGGALLMSLLSGRSKDKEYKPGISPALLGALLGGGAAVAAPLGYKMLTGDVTFGKPSSFEPVEGLADAVVGGAVANPFLAGGSLAGAGYAAKNLPFARNITKSLEDRLKNGTITRKQYEDALKTLKSESKPFSLFSGVKFKDPKTYQNIFSNVQTAPGRASDFLFNPSKRLANVRDLARFRNPVNTLSRAAVAPVLGYLIDTHMFGRS